MTVGNPNKRAQVESEACPVLPPRELERTSKRSTQDAYSLIVDAHDIDLREVLGRLTIWSREEPLRLVFAAFQLARWHDPNQPMSWLEEAVNATYQSREDDVA